MEQQNEIRDKKIVKEILLVEDCTILVKEEKCKELGAQTVLIKPIYIEMFKKAIEACLTNRQF